MKNSTNILLGIVGAAVAGVVIGMIVAPKKGEDLRADVKNSAGDFAKKLKDLLSTGNKKYDELRSMLGDDAKAMKHDAKDLAMAAGNAYNEFTQDGKKTKS